MFMRSQLLTNLIMKMKVLTMLRNLNLTQMTRMENQKSEQEQLTVEDDEPEPIQNENVPVLPEVSNNPTEQEQETSRSEDVPQVLVKSPDQEPEPAVSNEQRVEEAELATENDQALVDEKPTVEEISPFKNPKEESAVDGLATDQLPGDLGAYGNPDTEEKEAPVDDTVADLFKNEDRNNQGNSEDSDLYLEPSPIETISTCKLSFSPNYTV